MEYNWTRIITTKNGIVYDFGAVANYMMLGSKAP